MTRRDPLRISLVCKQCGRKFTGHQGNQFCSNVCAKDYVHKLDDIIEKGSLLRKEIKSYKKACKHCGKKFIPKLPNDIYCSIHCREDALDTRKSFTKVCKNCGSEFLTKNTHKNYCCKRCREEDSNLREPNTKVCKNCGSEFVTKNPRQIYCSKHCRDENSKPREQLTKYCKNCNNKFIAKNSNQVYCCKHCSEEYYAKQRNPSSISLICNQCGKIFFGSPERQYCSKGCEKKHIIEQKLQDKGYLLKCTHCRKKFRSLSKKTKFCSKECREIHRYKIVCKICGNTFFAKSTRSKYCSEKCSREANRQYKKTPSNDKNNDCAETEDTLKSKIKSKVDLLIMKASDNVSNIDYNLIGTSTFETNKKKVLKRDGYQCYVCGKDVELEIHHITPRSWGGGHDADNLITLCASCHRHIETRDKYHAYRMCLKNALRYHGLFDEKEDEEIAKIVNPAYYTAVLERVFKLLGEDDKTTAMIEIATALDEFKHAK